MSPPTERTLASKLDEIVRAWLAPFGEGLSEKARESVHPRPADEIDELVGELRAVELERKESNP
ncbi:MAG: hypothetical protein WEB53_09335 [Akkermansiaceae bacterium]